MTHRYGPHDPEHAPTTVTVHRMVDGIRQELEVPLSRAQLKQRRDLNNLAWEAGRCPSSS